MSPLDLFDNLPCVDNFSLHSRNSMKVIILLLAAILYAQTADGSLQDDYFKLSAEDIDGNEVKFEKFKGMVSALSQKNVH